MRLFGVRIVEGKLDNKEEEEEDDKENGEEGEEMMRKSQSMNNLFTITNTNTREEDKDQGYLSDGNLATSSKAKSGGYHERKKGRAWTREEHMRFLIGMERLGKGDWKGVSKNFVRTRTASQIASHAQKYFLRLNNPIKKRRRSSLFDPPPPVFFTKVDGVWKFEQFPGYGVPGQVFGGLNSCFNANVGDFQKVSTVAPQAPQSFGANYHHLHHHLQVKTSEGLRN